jgi:hypothetical protein
MPDLGAIHAILNIDLGAETDLTTASLLGNAARELALLGTDTALAAVLSILGSESERARMAAAMALTGAIQDGRLDDDLVVALVTAVGTDDPSPRVRDLVVSRLATPR